MASDITELILAHHAWFREQFVRLDDAAAAPSDVDALRALWEPLATKLDLHAVAEEEIFYPQLLRRGTQDPREETLDAIGDHNEIRDGVHAAAAATIGTPQWWAAVAQTREANDEHMAEEEREGIPDFRRNAPTGLRESLGRRFARFFEEHETTDGGERRGQGPTTLRRRGRARHRAGPPERRLARDRQSERTAPAMTATDHLLRDLAPIPAKAWEEIQSEARDRLTAQLAARRLTDWSGPHGWQEDRLSVGRTADIAGPPGGSVTAEVQTAQRRVLAYAEIKVPFTVSRREIDDIQRGATDAELDDLDRAAHAAALTENRAVFHGWPAAGITGSPTRPATRRPRWATTARPTRRSSRRPSTACARRGIGGPYALAISPARYTRIVETTEHGGYLLVDHLTRVLGGEVIWSPGLDGALVLSQRGGDFVLAVGQDWSVGYSAHDAETVQLYLEETLTFRAIEPDAVIVLAGV